MIRGVFPRLLAVSVCCAAAGAQPSPRLGTGVPDLDARLTALTPARPMDYFLLAEEVASEIDTDDGRALARRLFVLSYHLSDAGVDGKRVDFARSVCLALVEEGLLTDDDERRFVLALSAAIGGSADLPAESPDAASGEAGEDVALSLATALGEYRAGRFQEAAALLEQPGVRGLLAQHAPLLRNLGVMLRDIESRPNCRECRNRRIVRDDVNPDARYRLCRTCGGDPSPALAPIDFIAILRTESLLLGATDASWSAQLSSGRVEPFVDVDPARLASRLGVATDRTIWREGGWVSPDSPSPAALPGGADSTR
jgi:hypothetical protein